MAIKWKTPVQWSACEWVKNNICTFISYFSYYIGPKWATIWSYIPGPQSIKIENYSLGIFNKIPLTFRKEFASLEAVPKNTIVGLNYFVISLNLFFNYYWCLLYFFIGNLSNIDYIIASDFVVGFLITGISFNLYPWFLIGDNTN